MLLKERLEENKWKNPLERAPPAAVQASKRCVQAQGVKE